MCGRLVRDRDFDAALSGYYEFSETRITPRWNIASTQLDLSPCAWSTAPE